MSMLVKNVRRGDGTKVLIGNDISVELVRAKEGSITLRIDAPREVRVVTVDTDSNQVE